MTKEEKIKEVYGRNFELCNPDKNGYFDLDKLDLMSFPDLLDLEYCPLKRMHVLKSLKGIEGNNGWIKIESDSDLPKYDIECYITNKIGRIQFGEFEIETGRFFVNNDRIYPTHYQKVIKPKKPLY